MKAEIAWQAVSKQARKKKAAPQQHAGTDQRLANLSAYQDFLATCEAAAAHKGVVGKEERSDALELLLDWSVAHEDEVLLLEAGRVLVLSRQIVALETAPGLTRSGARFLAKKRKDLLELLPPLTKLTEVDWRRLHRRGGRRR